jgi:ferredoxin-NADP reductase
LASGGSSVDDAGQFNETIELRINAVRYAARDTLVFELENPDGALLPAAEAGSHIGLHLKNGLLRQYSLVETGRALRKYVIAVKRDESGRGGSRFMHDVMRVGEVVKVDRPRNNFPLVEDAPHTVLIAGGIGITPILSMARRLKELGRSFSLVYSCRAREFAAFLPEVEALGHARLHFDAEAQHVIDLASATEGLAPHTHLYCCGPVPMLSAFEQVTNAFPHEQVHVEYFTAKEEAAVSGGYSVSLARSGKQFDIPPGRTILQVLRDGGVDIPFSCEQGVCGACETAVLEGLPDHRDAILSEPERAANNTMMICCSGCKTQRLVLDL